MISLNNFNPALYIPYYTVQNSPSSPNFQPAQVSHPVFWDIGSRYIKNYAAPQINSTVQSYNIPWISDPIIKDAVNKLDEAVFSPEDVNYIKNMGVNVIFNNGREALNLAAKKGIRIEFGTLSDPDAHSEWIQNKNLIMVNEKYRGTTDPAVVLAISEAIVHELGHASDNDGKSSIQEEFDCLALNTLAFRFHQNKYNQIFNNSSNADIIRNGVELYANLFFDPDPEKKGLKQRIRTVYGDLPPISPNHKPAQI